MKLLFILSKGRLWATERLSTASESPGQWKVGEQTLVFQGRVLKPACLELSLVTPGSWLHDF